MNAKQRKAFDAINGMAPHGHRLAYAHEGENSVFTISAEDRDRAGNLLADYYGEEIRERVEDDIIQNAFGIRTDIHTILAKAGLFAEWQNPGMLGAFEA